MSSSMEDGFNFKKLKAAILELSVSVEWSVAKGEWLLEGVYEVEEPVSCLCGHMPIIEICVLRNEKNGKNAEVGNICVHKFIGLGSKIIFDCLGRIRKDDSKALNNAATEHFYKKGSITNWERSFLIDTFRKRILSKKQLDQRRLINCKVLKAVRRKGL